MIKNNFVRFLFGLVVVVLALILFIILLAAFSPLIILGSVIFYVIMSIVVVIGFFVFVWHLFRVEPELGKSKNYSIKKSKSQELSSGRR